MMESPLVTVFLAVIAVTALLQTVFVGALAFGVRLGARKLALIERGFEHTIEPQIRNASRLMEKAAAMADQSLVQARRADSLVAEVSRKAERYVDRAASGVEGAVERAAERVESEVAARAARAQEHPLLRRISGVSAFAIGLRRALEVWQAGAEPIEPDAP
jgi:predicted ATP-grasp superfamily ATP-dependent carboligase